MCQLSVVAYTRNPSTWEKAGKGPRILQETWSQSIINPSINPYLLSMLKNKHQMLGMAVCIYNSSYSRYWNKKIIKFKASVCNTARDILSHNKNFKKEWRTRRMTQQARVCTAYPEDLHSNPLSGGLPLTPGNPTILVYAGTCAHMHNQK